MITPTDAGGRRRAFIEANIAGTHAFQAGLHRRSGRGAPAVWAEPGLGDDALRAAVAHQEELLAAAPDAVAAWVATGAANGGFDPARHLQPLLAMPLAGTARPDLPANVFADCFARQPGASLEQARALAGLLQMMLDTLRDGDRLQELFAHCVRLDLPVHTARIGLAARSDDDFLAVARRLAPAMAPSPFATDAAAVRMLFRKLWNWGHRHTGERDRRVVAAELMGEPAFRALLPRLRALPPQRIAVVGHSFTMEVHWQAPSAFVPIAAEILRHVNPRVEVRQWAAGGLALSRPDAAGLVAAAREWRPDRLLFVVAFDRAEDYDALARMTAELHAAGVGEVAVFDRIRPARQMAAAGDDEERLRAVARATGLKVVAAGAALDASPDVERFVALDGIHMTEPYHRLMARLWLETLPA